MRNKQTILLDTNALINFLSGELLETDIVDGRRITISEITEMEIQCNPELNSSERILLKEFLGECIIIRLNEEIKDLAIKIRLSTRMKLMDSIIAASAQWTKLILVTGDEKFDSVKSIDLILLPSKNKRL
jgi:predicted nucleic acid-binding protein